MPANRSAKNGQNVEVLTRKEARRLFDRRARKLMKMSGEEFLRRWKVGEFGDPDNPYRPELCQLVMMIPLAE
ncbi:MAG: hypothetical protein AAB225_31895 [Acidobacteriota bacterium]